jgi:type I restriction enzyme M protein
LGRHPTSRPGWSKRYDGAMKLTQQQLEAHLMGAANILRGRTAGQDYKNYILSLMFYKRLSDQWEHEADEAIKELEQQQGREFTEAERAASEAFIRSSIE